MLELIIKAASAFTALGAFVGAAAALYRWKSEREENDRAFSGQIDALKTETAVICEALSACLDGLIQLGANHDVPKAKERLKSHLNEQAHK